VLLCVLLLGLTNLPASALCRPETRVGGSPAFSSVFASQETANPVGTPSENGGRDYDFASGVHKYLYAQDNPVDGSDPSGNDDLDSMSMAVYSSAFLSSLNIIESVGVVPASIAPYPVVVVTLPNGTQYMPKTKVKDSAQVAIAGVPINTPIYISVPPTENPQAMVNYWSTHSFYDNEFAFRDYFKGGGTHDYKLKNSIWDAFGNFNYGACGEAAGVPHWLLQHEANKGKPGGNNPINTADINSGFDAIAKGGKLSTKMESLVPPSSSP